MNTKIYLASALLAAMAAPAFAGNLEVAVVEPVVEAPAAPVVAAEPEVTWDGFYAGFHATRSDATWTTATIEDEGEELVYGLHAGYNHDLGDFVIGAEAGASVEQPMDRNETTLTGKVKAGYDMGKFLPYATAGYSLVTSAVDGAADNKADGWVYGVGAEYLVSEKVGLGAEYLMGDYDVTDGGADEFERSDISVRANFHF